MNVNTTMKGGHEAVVQAVISLAAAEEPCVALSGVSINPFAGRNAHVENGPQRLSGRRHVRMRKCCCFSVVLPVPCPPVGRTDRQEACAVYVGFITTAGREKSAVQNVTGETSRLELLLDLVHKIHHDLLATGCFSSSLTL